VPAHDGAAAVKQQAKAYSEAMAEAYKVFLGASVTSVRIAAGDQKA